jgi:hypothetical protein
VLAFQAADALATASRLLDLGDRDAALVTLRERRDVLIAGAELWNDAQLRRDATLLGRYARVVGGVWDRFAAGDRHTLLMAMNTFADRRMR